MKVLIFILISLLLALTLFCSTTIANQRQSLEISIGIGIGGGGGSSSPSTPATTCPPPPPPPRPTPSPPTPRPRPPPRPPTPRPPNRHPPSSSGPKYESQYIEQAYEVIQRFKKLLDPNSNRRVLNTWKGPNVCNNPITGRRTNVGYMGFYCEALPGESNKNKNRRLASVDFNTFHLYGKNKSSAPLTGFLDQLPDLALFHANSNDFTSVIPPLSKLKYFYELDVSNNNHTGNFPNTVLPILNLTFLDIRFNQFAGLVPPSSFTLPNLQVLFLNNNQFTGNIPSNLGSTPANYITFANNYFTGPIPSSIGQACNTLLEILFLNNKLSGCLPYQIGLLNKATVFDAGFNRITGPIPMSFGCLSKIEQLNLAGNLLYGEVPDALCKLFRYGSNKNLSLSDNYFTKLGPSCYGLDGSRFCVNKNCIPGLPNQRSAEECAEFLKRPKVLCSNSNYIPCRLSKIGNDELNSNGEGVHAGNGYATYSALHIKDKKP